MNAAAFLLLGALIHTPGIGQESIVDWTARHEGFREHPYRDTRGYATVGYGHRCQGDYRSLTEPEAKRVLIADLQLAQNHAEHVYPDVESKPTPVKFVLVALAFQLGEMGLRRFVRMHAAIDASDYPLAGAELRGSTLYSQCPRRTEDLAAILENAR